MNTKEQAPSLPRSFAWLNATQFLGALNDNVFRFLVIFFLVVGMGQTDRRASVMAISWAVFVVPFLLFSHAAGVLADRISKRSIIVFSKYLEVAVMALGCAAIYSKSAGALYALIFLMATQSAIFGPSKYGIIPEIVAADALSKANSLLVCLSYLAIIIGTFIPSFLLLRVLDGNFLAVSVFCVAVAALGVLTSLKIHPTPPAGTGKRFSVTFVVEIFRTLRGARATDRYLLSAVIGAAYFLYLGAFIQQNLMLYGNDYLKLGWIESGYLFPVAALGIGVGAMLTGKLSGRNIEFGIVPIGALGLTFCCMALSFIPPGLAAVLVIMFLIGMSGGLFIVPLDAFIQYRSPRKQLGEILACVNFLSFLGAALAAATMLFLDEVLDLNPSQCFLVIGVMTGALAVAAVIMLPDFLVRFVIVVLTRVFYRITVVGRENVPLEGPALLVSNHVTWVDALLIGATQQRRVRFVMAREIFENRRLKPIFKLMGVIPVSPTDPPRQIVESLRKARAALDDGYLVCIFAEGAITRNGNMRSFKPGLERILKGSSHPVIPVCIAGAWGSIFSYYHGKLLAALPKTVPYPVAILFGTPMPAHSTTWEIRRTVLELSGKAFDFRKSPDRILPKMFARAARSYWFHTALLDGKGARLSFGRTLTTALALAGQIGKTAGKDQNIGVLLPASVSGALVNVAVTLLGRVPVNLNFTASPEAVQSAIKQCGINTIISSGAFLDKLEKFKPPAGTVFLEDIIRRISPAARCKAFLAALLMPIPMLNRSGNVGPDTLATVVFSSGSTGEPKGIMLSHHNIISNIESFQAIFRFKPDDGIAGILPFFHSFGYTCTLWCPLLSGCSVSYHPNPMDGVGVASMVRANRLTILMATPTFLLNYIRRAPPEDFAGLRAVVVGAEKLKQRIADDFERKFGIRPLEGYGATELSPVAAAAIPNVETGGMLQIGAKEGSVGHPVPGVVMKIVVPDSGETLPEGEEGLLMVKGPNVMMGYLNNPAKTAEVLRDEWYDTGDIARIDGDGFLFLLDRMSRFSKIGGEMVPHIAIENELLQALNSVGPSVVVTGAPDEKKGEQLVVLYTEEAGAASGLQDIIARSALPNLWKPRKENYVKIESMPILGSGKLDLKRIQKIAREFVEKRS